MTSQPVPKWVSRVADEQPTFGDTDEELGIKGRDSDADSDDDLAPAPVAVKRQKTSKAKERPPERIYVVSRTEFYATYEKLGSAGYDLAVWTLNHSVRLPSDVTPMACFAYRNDSQCENLEVDERVTPAAQRKKLEADGRAEESMNGWEPGRADLAGIAVAAWEIADYVVKDDMNVAIVASEIGGDAAKLLGGCAAQAVRRMATAEEAKAIIGTEAPQPKKEQFRKIYRKFRDWTRTTAAHEIMDHAV